MTTRAIVFLVLLSAGAVLLFAMVARQLSLISLGLAATAESEKLLRDRLDDQRRLAELDPGNRDLYRARFEETRTLVNRLEVLSRTRESLTRRFEWTLIGVVVMIVVAGVLAYLIEQKSRTRRLATLATALQALSRGEQGVVADEHRRDVIGQFAAMIEQTSQVMGRERRRLESLEHLSAWQESARVLAHEIRTPLMALRLEMSRLIRASKAGATPEELMALEKSVEEEVDQLELFSGSFIEFGSLGKPAMARVDLAAVVAEFCELFAGSWPSLTLSAETDGELTATADRQMLRRVFANLCKNSAMSGATNVRFSIARRDGWIAIDVADDGPGVPPHIRPRLFEPYVTTRASGDNLGLGLSISKKIMLDHGGDLELVDTEHGAHFRLTLQ